MSVNVAIEARGHLSYAMAHNKIAFLTKLTLRNDGGELTGAEVIVEVRDSEGLVSHPYVRTADLGADGTVELTSIDAQLDPQPMLDITDERPAKVIVRVMHGGDEVGASYQNVSLLPGNHWLAQPPGLAYELLAAFVQPNDPAVTELLSEVSAILASQTGSPSVEGYQSGPERVDAIAGALWTAVQRRTIRYAEPPASWGSIGQKVRFPSTVLIERIGTCLDTTLLFAAALEQAGIRPLLWIIDGHSFLGYWRVETALGAVAYPDGTEVVNDVDRGLMGLVETTAVTVGQEVDFAESQRRAAGHLRDLSVVRAVVDIWVARNLSILPLPSRRREVDGTVSIHSYQPAAPAARSIVITATSADGRAPRREAAPPRVQQWKNSLLDLTLRNRLINYTARAGVSVAVPEGQLGLVEDLLSASRPITLRPSDSVDSIDAYRGLNDGRKLPQARLQELLMEKSSLYADVTTAAYNTRMRGLAYKARTIVEETGANNLYVALGSLMWRLDNRQLKSPLILVPVNLVPAGRGQSYRVVLDDTGASTPNYCLLEKLRQVDGLEVPLLENPEQDDSGIDLDGSLRAMREAIAAKGLPYRVEESADLSILQFAKFRLWKDLDEHWEALTRNSLVHHLTYTPNEPFTDPVTAPIDLDLDELDALCPVPADASQLGAVAEAVAGRTFVLEGPPGTGKSQTITNLLTRAVAEKRRVLFVAEKRAALDVVRARLDGVGMGPFSLDLHDRSSKPAVVRAQIKEALEHHVDVDVQGLDVEREDLRTSRRALARYAVKLHESNDAGLSLYTAQTGLLALGQDEPGFEVPLPLLTGDQSERLDSVRRAIRGFPDVAEAAHLTTNHPWGFARSTGPTDSRVVREASAHARSIESALSTLGSSDPLGPTLSAVTRPAELRAMATLLASSESLATIDAARAPSWRSAADALLGEVQQRASSTEGLGLFTPAALGLDSATITHSAQIAAASGFFGRKKRLQAVVDQIRPGLKPDTSVAPKQAVVVADQLATLQADVAALIRRADDVRGVELGTGWQPWDPASVDQLRRRVALLTALSDALPTQDTEGDFVPRLRALVDAGAQISDAEARALSAIAAAWTGLVEILGVNEAELAAWCAGAGLLERWRATAAARRVGGDDELPLRRWLEAYAALEPLRKAGMSAAASTLMRGDLHHDEANRALKRGVARASLEERSQATGIDAFDPIGHERNVAKYLRSSKAVRSELTNAVPDEVLKARDFDAAASFGRIGELHRELTKQRRALGVRALMQKYGDLITQVMPCVLVSPDSVARFFPADSQDFDIVVFDEASQIRVADAVGTMGRGKSVVVVGDSKQMPPSTFGESTGGDDDANEELVVPDSESILTEADAARVPKQWLTWHYRSQDESLIAFSNEHYYDGRLSSFPAPSTGDPLATGRGISLVRVDGTFHRSGTGKLLRTNPVEAEAIVADLQRRFAASPDRVPSVGVITFNQQQRAAIEALIRDGGDERLVEALDSREGEGLFVKNLENVQGDERDVIIFSCAFSVNEKGNLPLNFGPLTRAGGERRLNVAVTRARRQVVLYSSFDPGRLRVEETSSKGIHHLRAYLELAQHGAETWASGARTARAVPDRHRDQLAAALRNAGLHVKTDVGLSEFRIDIALAATEGGDPLVAVLLDGQAWASRRTVGDRDGLPAQVLGQLMGWRRVERVWLPDWLRRPDEVVERLRASVDEARLEPPPTQPALPIPAVPETQAKPAPSQVAPQSGVAPERWLAPTQEPATAETISRAPAATSAALPGQEVYTAFVPRPRGDRSVLDALPAHYAAEQVRKVMLQVLEVEAPIHQERLARLVAACFDLSRLSPGRIKSILSAMPSSAKMDRAESFVWTVNQDPDVWGSIRLASDRPIEHVPLREIGNAMVALCRAAAGMSADELDAAALGVFGGKRRTTGISARLAAARDRTVATGRLHVGVNGLHIVPR